MCKFSSKIKSLLVFAVTILCFPGTAISAPETPSINRNVHTVENLEFISPYVPAVQTSADGRLGISHAVKDMKFYLQRPESINAPLLYSENGASIKAPDTRAALVPSVSGIDIKRLNHVALCDASFAPNSGTKNPRACGANDCYDLKIISTIRTNLLAGEDKKTPGLTVVGFPVTVKVGNPKTTGARIISVETGDLERGSSFESFKSFFEPMTAGKGKLLVGRLAGSTINWTDSDGRSRTSGTDVVYLVNDNPNQHEACDVAQWDKVYPLSHAPYDDTINKKYGFAFNKFRDSLGRVIPEGTRIGTYPWIDRDANNVSITTFLHRDLYHEKFPAGSEYPAVCVVPDDQCINNKDATTSGPLGRAIFGLWTQGKVVLMDNMLNNIDYGIGSADGDHRLLKIYSNAENKDKQWIRAGDGNDRDSTQQPEGNVVNSAFFDTNEHRFNYFQNMFPVTSQDVVWTMSTGRSTDEVGFDDFTNLDSFINLNMTRGLQISLPTGRNVMKNDALQNAATALPQRWTIPQVGEIVGSGRVEPVANGGVHGKGFWMNGSDTAIRIAIPKQQKVVNNHPWFYSIFIDQRSAGQATSLITFPDNSEIRTSASGELVYVNAGGIITRTITLPAVGGDGWKHLAWQVSNDNRHVKTYFNGYQVDDFTANSGLFSMVEGSLWVGYSPNDATLQRFKGWVDDFKVFAQKMNPEVVCNHANGTLAGIQNTGNVDWSRIANNYPGYAHEEISNVLSANQKATFDSYVCVHDYSGDKKIVRSALDKGLVSVRDDLNFPEGPLYADRPRPDSRKNEFCKSCHQVGAGKGLKLHKALKRIDDVNAIDDERRQPMQPEATVYGHIPAHWLGRDKPSSALVTGPDGFKIDNWLLGNSPNKTPVALADSNLNRAPKSFEQRSYVRTDSSDTIDVDLYDYFYDPDNNHLSFEFSSIPSATATGVDGQISLSDPANSTSGSSSPPSSLVITPEGRLVGTVDLPADGMLDLGIKVSDGAEEYYDTLTLSFYDSSNDSQLNNADRESNSAPELVNDEFDVIPYTNNSRLYIDVATNFRDDDGDTLVFQISNLLDGLEMDEYGVISGTPQVTGPETLSRSIIVVRDGNNNFIEHPVHFISTTAENSVDAPDPEPGIMVGTGAVGFFPFALLLVCISRRRLHAVPS